jgi:hypothetical protein
MKKYLFILALALTAALVFTFTACDDNPFVKIIDIEGVATEGFTGETIELPKYATPHDLTHPPITWTIKDRGDNDGLVIIDIEVIQDGNPVDVKAISGLTATGDIVITGTVKDGVAKGTNFVKDFTISIGQSVTGNIPIYALNNGTVNTVNKYITIEGGGSTGFYIKFSEAGITWASGKKYTITYKCIREEGTGTAKFITKNNENSWSDAGTSAGTNKYPDFPFTTISATGTYVVYSDDLASSATGVSFQHNSSGNSEVVYIIAIMAVDEDDA